MNKRILIYVVIAVVLFMALSGDDNAVETHPFNFNKFTEAFFKTECMKDLVGYSAPARSKMRFCDCVVANFSTVLLANQTLRETLKSDMALYESKNADSYDRSRFLSRKPANDFTTGHIKLDLILRPNQIKFQFDEMQPHWDELSKSLDLHWKEANATCVKNISSGDKIN